MTRPAIRHTLSAIAAVALVSAFAGSAVSGDPTGEGSLGLWQINRDKERSPTSPKTSVDKKPAAQPKALTTKKQSKTPKRPGTNKGEDVQVLQELLNK